MARLVLFAVFALFLIVPGAGAQDFDPPKQIISKKDFPLRDLNFIRTKGDKTYLISPDGRYVFQGELFDVWNGERIDSLQEFARLSGRMDMQHLGIEPSRMFTLDIGSGEKVAYIFVDPNCSHCPTLVRDIVDSDGMDGKYQIKVVPIAVLSENSFKKAKKLSAVAEKDPQKALDIFLEGSYDKVKTGEGKFPALKYNVLVATALSIKNVPYLVNPAGVVHVGVPRDMRTFLERR